ncbi:MAG: 1,4-dihydroxy-2-naphthoate polyprenyltransferase [Balneolaceae bacterium]|nr:1,4-dihydroxy-2-naphthoate polyprenyltransferase [Balneolaceae bacterium]
MHWIQAARPQTLAAALVPIMVGASIAAENQLFRWDTTFVALFCAFAIQIGTNFANDYFDHVKGADTPDRIGFERATAMGYISPGAMLNATILTMGIAFLAGLYLVWIGGWVILVIGILSLLFGVLYTGGPYPLGYNGLGDIFVFIFFGIVAVMGTYYVNALEWSAYSFWASLPVGALCVNILVVNNLRDVDQDRIAGKRTLGVLLGESALKLEYLLMLLLSYTVPILFFLSFNYSAWILLPLLSIPGAVVLMRQIFFHEDKSTLNRTLERTAQFMVLYGLLFTAGILL